MLDTNVVFDWLLFRDPACDQLNEAISSGAVHWIATPEMAAEADHVLARGTLDAWLHRRAEFLRLRSEWMALAPVQSDLVPGQKILCSDPDDQKFIDLATTLPATWLLTRDNALLKLHARARLAGVRICRPRDWRLQPDS